MADTVMVQVKFTVKTEMGEFTDALYYSLANYQNMPSSWIETEKQARVNNWINAVKNPPIPIPPTKADLLAQKAALQDQIVQLDSAIVGAK